MMVMKAVALAFLAFGGGGSVSFAKEELLSVGQITQPSSEMLHLASENPDFLHRAFSIWAEANKKVYRNAEEHDRRRNVFLESMREVVRHNARRDVTFRMAMNANADLTAREFERLYALGLSIGDDDCSATEKSTGNNKLRGSEDDDLDLPMAFDWRDHNAVTPVKNQGHCGSCWTFSTTGAVEAHWKKVTGKTLDLAEQQLVDCAQAFDNHGCNGGLPSHAFEYIIEVGGIEAEQDYNYHAQDETCKFDDTKIVATLASSVNITRGDERALLRAVAKQGPVSIAFQVVGDFRLYSTGVYSSTTCGNRPKDVNHAVLAVGYGTDENGTPYWIVKNSWGTSFGEDGYFRIRRGVNMCGVAVCNSYPLVTGEKDMIDDEIKATTSSIDVVEETIQIQVA